MNVFITGTDTDIGKTLVSSWLCLHTGYDYFKPIQTGSIASFDSHTVATLSNVHVHKESYVFKAPLSPHMAAQDEAQTIDFDHIQLPKTNHLVVEGAGGIKVPINDTQLMSDLVLHFEMPCILVARSKLGTINHTLLSLDYMRQRNINVLGVVMSGDINPRNRDAIEKYGQVEVLAELPHLKSIDYQALKKIPLTSCLKKLFKVTA